VQSPGAGANTYTYDGLARLTSWKAPTNQQTTYGYDNASNRTTVTDPTGTRTTVYDARNRALSANGAGKPAETWTWTARGTMSTHTSGTTVDSSTFDAFERLTQASNPNYTVTYTYDALDRLAQRNGLGFLYNDLTNQPIQTPMALGQDTQVLRDPDGQPLSDKTTAGTGRNLITDGIHHDVTGASNSTTGDLTASRTYQPYGQTVASTGTLPLGYQGGWTDPETTRTNAHARWYDSATGAFTSRDTLTLNPYPLAQANRYGYANSNPVTGVDSNGHSVGIDDLVVVGGLTATEEGILAAGAVGAPESAGATLIVAGVIIIGFSFYDDYHNNPQRGGRISRAPTSSRGGGYGYGLTGTPSLPSLDYCERNPHAARCAFVYAPGDPGGSDGGGRGPGSPAPCSRRCGSPPPTPPCVLQSLAAGFRDGILCRIPWLDRVALRPKSERSDRPGSESLTLGSKIANNPNVGNDSQPSVNEDKNQETSPTGAGGDDGGRPPVSPPTSGCTPDPDDDDWVDPERINFSQRTVSPNDYVKSMQEGTWDWSRPGTALRVIERGGQLVSYDNRRLDAAREVRAQDPNYRVKVERLDPTAPNPAKSTGMNWYDSFEKRMKSKRNRDENGCRVPWDGLYERPIWE
jgi:RHS repeat-associated protein